MRKDILEKIQEIESTQYVPKGYWRDQLEFLKDYKITFDYGFYGILLPVLIILPNNYYEKFIAATLGVALLSFKIGGIQWWSLMALIPIALYNGQKGKLNIKYMFYAFYPIHIAVIYAIKLFL